MQQSGATIKQVKNNKKGRYIREKIKANSKALSLNYREKEDLICGSFNLKK